MPELQPSLPWWLSKTQRRECYEGASQLLPEISIIGRFHLLKAASGGLLADTHDREFELHLIEEAFQDIWINSPDQQYNVVGGSAVLTRPGQLHGGVRQLLRPGRWSMIRFNLDLLDNAEVTAAPPKNHIAPFRASATDYVNALNGITTSVFSYSSALEDCFMRLLDEHRNRTSTARPMARILLKELILHLARDSEAHAKTQHLAPAEYSTPIRHGLAWLETNLCKPIRVEDAAIAAGLSESHFRRWFQKEIGFSPADYVMYRRIELSKKLLLNKTQSITRIALELGFSTSAYFTFVFRKKTGITPTQFRDEVRAGKSLDSPFPVKRGHLGLAKDRDTPSKSGVLTNGVFHSLSNVGHGVSSTHVPAA